MTPPRKVYPTAAEARILAAWPEGDGWFTADQLAAHLDSVGGLPTHVPLSAALSNARRRGWVLRSRRTTPDTYRRTPSGHAFAAVQAAAKEGNL